MIAFAQRRAERRPKSEWESVGQCSPEWPLTLVRDTVVVWPQAMVRTDNRGFFQEVGWHERELKDSTGQHPVVDGCLAGEEGLDGHCALLEEMNLFSGFSNSSA